MVAKTAGVRAGSPGRLLEIRATDAPPHEDGIKVPGLSYNEILKLLKSPNLTMTFGIEYKTRIRDGAREHVGNFVETILQLPHLILQREYYEHGETLQEEVQSLIEKEFERMTVSTRRFGHSEQSRVYRINVKSKLQTMYGISVMNITEALDEYLGIKPYSSETDTALWEAVVDKNNPGEIYYWNTATNETRWERPGPEEGDNSGTNDIDAAKRQSSIAPEDGLQADSEGNDSKV